MPWVRTITSIVTHGIIEHVLLYGLFIRIAMPSAGVFRNAFQSRGRLPATVLDTLYPLNLKMTSLSGYWDADHDRPRTRNTRPSNAQCTNIFISKSVTFSLRTLILLLASVSLAPHRKYTMRQIGKKPPVVPLCEWINHRAKQHTC